MRLPLFALLAQCSASATSAPLSPDELRAHPGNYAGKTVQIKGKLTECAGWECSICPEEMTTETRDADRCLPLEFRSLMKGAGFGADAREATFRFASVTINARFDPACWRGLCTDRAPVLFDADVVETLQRRKSRSGLWLGQRTPLVPFVAPDAEILIAAAYKSGYPRGSSYQEKDPELAATLRQFDPLIKAFHIPHQVGSAIVCWAPSGLGEDIWPDSLEAAFNAPALTIITVATSFAASTTSG